MLRSISLFSGNANPPLTGAIAHHLEVPLGQVKCGRFSDGEIAVEIYAAYLRIQRERGASVVPALVSLMGSRQGELVRRAA